MKVSSKKRRALVCGGGGFIGSHLVKALINDDYWVKAVDLKYPEYSNTQADEFILGDLREVSLARKVFDQSYHEVYQLAADMGGAGYIFTGENDAALMFNSAQINLNILKYFIESKSKKIFFSSSACIYPESNQLDPNNPNCSENSAYPAAPDSEYGWEKIFSERLYLAFKKNYGANVRIARFHNIFGPEGAWNNGKEKAPAAICRKVAQAKDNTYVEIWGDGKQSRSFLYVDECLVGIKKLMGSDFCGPVNIGSEEMITIEDLVKMIIKISGKKLEIRYTPGPQGVRGRNSDNALIREKLSWEPNYPLKKGIAQTYDWINQQLNQKTPPHTTKNTL